MSKFKSLLLSKIHVPADRSREVDDNHALAICASIEQQGQITPVLIRQTPNGKAPYELVAGAHRHRAFQMTNLPGEPEIDCIIVKADREEAALLEVSENIFRNELSALDRAMAVQIYRDTWEKKHGEIDPKGGRPKNPANIAELIAEDAAGGFAEACAEQLGLSRRSIEYSQKIAKNLPKDLRQKLQGTPAADNQSMLLNFAKLPKGKLKAATKAIDNMEGDIAGALRVLQDKPVDKRTKQDKDYEALVNAWGRAPENMRKKFMVEFGLSQSKNPTKDSKSA